MAAEVSVLVIKYVLYKNNNKDRQEILAAICIKNKNLTKTK